MVSRTMRDVFGFRCVYPSSPAFLTVNFTDVHDSGHDLGDYIERAYHAMGINERREDFVSHPSAHSAGA
jgi:hypothetical protein